MSAADGAARRADRVAGLHSGAAHGRRGAERLAARGRAPRWSSRERAAARQVRTLAAHRPRCGRARRALAAREPRCGAGAGRGRSSTRAPRPRCCGRRRGRSASTPARQPTARGVTDCGSDRSSAGAWRPRRCCCRGARAAWPRLQPAPARSRQRRPRAGGAGRGRAVGTAATASATSPRSPTGPTPTRRASTACWRRGGRRPPGRRGQERPSCSSPAAARWSWTPPGAARRGRRGARCSARCRAAEYRALLRRARVFVCAPRREDYGLAQLEALADGCMLVTTPAPGPYAALPIARELDARLVGEDLAGALRAGARRAGRRCRLPRAGRRAARAVARRGDRPPGCAGAGERATSLSRRARARACAAHTAAPTVACWQSGPR